MENFNDLFLSEIPKQWENSEIIIPSKFYFRYKLKELFKRKKIFHSIKEQFNNEFDQKNDELLKSIIEKLPKTDQSDFFNFLNKRVYLSAHGMFVSNKKIINEYFSIIFPWYQSCEKIIIPGTKTTLDLIPRFFQYLNERFLDYWSNKYYNCKVWPIAMYNDQKNLITKIGKV